MGLSVKCVLVILMIAEKPNLTRELYTELYHTFPFDQMEHSKLHVRLEYFTQYKHYVASMKRAGTGKLCM